MSAQIMTWLTMAYLRTRDEERGQTLVEYTMVIALMVIGLAIVFSGSSIASKVTSTLSNVAGRLV